MMKKTAWLAVVFLLLAAFLAPALYAAGEAEIVLEKKFTSLTPTYMSGHEGDPQWISGFVTSGDIISGGTKIGTVASTLTLLNPPMSMTEKSAILFIKVTNTITGVGTFETTGMGVSAANSTTMTKGDFLLAWFGSLGNGAASLVGIQGLSSGVVSANIFSGSGEGRETLRVRFGD